MFSLIFFPKLLYNLNIWIRIHVRNTDRDPATELNRDPSGSGSATKKKTLLQLVERQANLIVHFRKNLAAFPSGSKRNISSFVSLVPAKLAFSAASRSLIHERTISLRFLGIILRVLRLEVSVYNVYIPNQF